MFSGWGKTIAVAIWLFAASAASASPTIISDSPAPIISSSADRAAGVATCNPGSDTVSDQMSEFASAILQPPQVNNQTTQAGDNHYLPALPPAIAMVLTGFICVSLVRDRRTWLTVIAGLLWVGQTGISALPQLTSRINRKVHNSQLFDASLTYSCPFGGEYFPDSYSEQTRFIGLLHHLEAIPKDGFISFTNKRVSPPRLCLGEFNVAGKDLHASQVAFTLGQLVYDKLVNCLVSGTRQFICFTPAFIFACLSRGPPISALKILL